MGRWQVTALLRDEFGPDVRTMKWTATWGSKYLLGDRFGAEVSITCGRAEHPRAGQFSAPNNICASSRILFICRNCRWFACHDRRHRIGYGLRGRVSVLMSDVAKGALLDAFTLTVATCPNSADH